MILYFFSKVLPLIFLPLGFSIILIFLSLFKKSKKFLYFALLYLIIFSTGITSNILLLLIEMPWKRLSQNQVSSADAIVVLSGGGKRITSKSNEIVEWNDPDRFLAGISLYKENKSKIIIFTGGYSPFTKHFMTEGLIYREEALKFGVLNKDIYVTDPVQNTYEEGGKINSLLKVDLGLKKPKILLITSAFHMNRASNIFKKYDIDVVEYPVDFKSQELNLKFIKNPLVWIPNSNYLNSSSIALREFLGRIVYR